MGQFSWGQSPGAGSISSEARSPGKTGWDEQGIKMHRFTRQDDVAEPAGKAGLLAPDTSGLNFYRADPALTDLLRIHMSCVLFPHIEPHLDRLRALARGQ